MQCPEAGRRDGSPYLAVRHIDYRHFLEEDRRRAVLHIADVAELPDISVSSFASLPHEMAP